MIQFEENGNIFVKKLGEFNESETELINTIYSPSYTIQPKKGDIYLRFNPEKNAIFAFIFSGESSKHYDQDFGAGEEYHYGENINFADFNDICISNNKYYPYMLRINEEFKKVEGRVIWEG